MNDQLRVTDHAVIRYLERVHNLDMDSVREKIREAIAKAYPAKDGKHYWNTEHRMIMVRVNNSVVTILNKKQAQKHMGRKLRDGGVIE